MFKTSSNNVDVNFILPVKPSLILSETKVHHNMQKFHKNFSCLENIEHILTKTIKLQLFYLTNNTFTILWKSVTEFYRDGLDKHAFLLLIRFENIRRVWVKFCIPK